MTSFDVDCVNCLSALREDKEFLLSARRWSTRVQLHMSDSVYYLDLDGGIPTRFSQVTDGYEPSDIVIAASSDTWAEVLSEVPRPFYQDLFSARVRHGLTMSGDLDDLFAHYGAIRRLTDVLRAVGGRHHG